MAALVQLLDDRRRRPWAALVADQVVVKVGYEFDAAGALRNFDLAAVPVLHGATLSAADAIRQAFERDAVEPGSAELYDIGRVKCQPLGLAGAFAGRRQIGNDLKPPMRIPLGSLVLLYSNIGGV